MIPFGTTHNKHSARSIIVAMDENNAIGYDNNLLCHLPADLKHFKSITSGHAIVMGRKTFESLPKGALPDRQNIVLTHDKQLHFDDCEMCTSLEDAFRLIKGDKQIFIIGGGSIYKQSLPWVDKLYITYIHHKFENANAFFPKINLGIWKEVSRVDHLADEKNKFAYSFVEYDRK